MSPSPDKNEEMGKKKIKRNMNKMMMNKSNTEK